MQIVSSRTVRCQICLTCQDQIHFPGSWCIVSEEPRLRLTVQWKKSLTYVMSRKDLLQDILGDAPGRFTPISSYVNRCVLGAHGPTQREDIQEQLAVLFLVSKFPAVF